MREEPYNVKKVDGFVLLQKTDDIRLRPTFDEILEVPTLRVVYFHLGFDLTDAVQGVHLSYCHLELAVLALGEAAEEVSAGRSVEEDRCVIHLVFEHS
jgi:hypothetical protein